MLTSFGLRRDNFSTMLRLLFVLALTSLPLAGLPAQGAIAAAGQEAAAPAPLNSGPQLILTKTVDDNLTEAQVGDVIRYRIRWECSSLTIACGQMEITDVLQDGLTYLPPPNSSVPGGFGINYDAGSRTVTITKADNNLLDGTQYDAVIAVRVNNDYRPLPGQIDNTVNGRIFPPGATGWVDANPASAPPIDIGPVSPSWELNKTRVAPVIEPTLDTDVTYRLQLCPVPPPSGGIADLTNITLTDTLPTGAVFVSASNGGTFSGGVVTWPTVPGPLSPPDCITQFVTMRYPSSDFDLGDDLTNSADVAAGYVDSDGDPCPACFGDSVEEDPAVLIDIVDVPTYSKSDAGDPVGITGTARFILELNTNFTNYPANDVVLIDNMPPQLQVTSVTSGTWSEDFDFVRAYIEYSIDYGSSWVAFPGQPVEYDTDATYDIGLPDNITNVRWRFEHDWDDDGVYTPGLPYVWAFSSNPEIRSTPRTTATNDGNGNPMPLAEIGEMYENCVYVTRTDNDGPIIDDCEYEEITIQGDFASLRVSKDETPGTSWDEWEDPLVNDFSVDATLLPGDTLRYVLRVELTERSSAPLINPTILDTLPDDLIFVRAGAVRLNGILLADAEPAAVVTFTHSQPNGNPGANQTLQWQITNLTVPELELGNQVLTVEFFARIPRGQLPGSRTNEMFVDTESDDVICENGAPRDNGCETTDTYIVERSAALRGEKWIRSVAEEPLYNSVVVHKDTFAPDASCPDGGASGMTASTNSFTRFPCISQAYPEGALSPTQHVGPPDNPLLDDFEYQLRIFNDGNVDMLNYWLYDILPYYGDYGSGGTLFNTARESEFRPVMTGPVQFLGGASLNSTDFVIQYSLSVNPCRPQVFNQGSGNIPAGCDANWYAESAIITDHDWSAVRAYRIILNASSRIAPYNEIAPNPETNILRFGIPMSIPADSPVIGVFNNDDALSREIAWNSFSHVGSYQDTNDDIRDLLASEPRKVGITIPERFSIGNRVWRDSDNSGTINAPDDTDPGIENVLVHLYLASDTTTPIATTRTDSGGYYLFSNLPAEDYVVGIPPVNFDPGEPLENLRSSTGTPASTIYTNPLDANPDSSDHGIDPLVLGQEVFSPVITLSAGDEPVSESDLSDNERDGPAGTRRGVNGERDENSDLTVDFGFFGGSDIPFSIGNHLWYDNGTGGGTINDGLRHPDEPPVAGARIDLYRDGNLDGILAPDELIRFDITDANGFYLFDNLDPGSYYVVVSAGNFQNSFDPDGPGPLPVAPGVLAGWYSSQPTFSDDVDQNDNGINTDFPESTGVRSNVIVLERGVDTPLDETHLSGEADPGAPANEGYNPTGWDGEFSRGRFGEPDENSNLTIDFGFIPPMSLGNRVWIDNGAGEAVFRSQYNNGIQDGTEAGVANARVELWRDNGDGVFNTTTDDFMYFTATDAQGYYLFERLQPGNYFVHIPSSNFASGQPLFRYISSFDRTSPLDDAVDMNDNGIDVADPSSTGVTSPQIGMAYDSEPLTPANELDINNSGTYGPDNRGNYGQLDENSNLTIDFGFVLPPRSIGNHLWFDEGASGGTPNDRIRQANETPVVGARVSLYRDSDNNGVPDDAAIAHDITDANGFYLFDNLPPGRYLVGVDNTNFQSGGPLFGYTSSVGTLTNADQRDNGIDRVMPYDATASPYGILSATVDVRVTVNSPTGESHLSIDTAATLGFNPTAADGPLSRGRFGEADNRSNLRIDFGFFRPMSLGNRVFYDNGAGANLNNGIMDGDESGVLGARVELYRDNGDGVFGAGDTLVNWDTTDANGFYLFDSLTPGNYFAHIPASNFDLSGSGPLRGWHNSTPTFSNDVDRNDNGVNNAYPATNGITSNLVTLAWDSAPTGETELSGQANPGAPGNAGFNPTGWDGPDSRGRWGEPDNNSNLTIDFGFIPPLSLGNRVWIDDGAIVGGLDLSLFNDGLMNGTEAGQLGVILHLFYDADDDGDYISTVDGVDESDPYRITTTDANGHYLFDGLPEGRFYVLVAPSNFASGGALEGYRSSTGVFDNETGDLNDNGIDDADFITNGIRSRNFVLNYGAEPQLETDISADTAAFGPLGIGRFGETDPNSNLTLDFGFVALRSLGNRVWLDNGAGGGAANNSIQDGTELGIDGVTVSLYQDNDGDGIPDGPAILTTTTSDGGYYLFSNFPAGRYVVGIDASNFQPSGVLEMLVSSLDVVNPVDATPDRNDHGIDAPNLPVTGLFSPSIDMRSPPSEPTGETDLSGRPQDGPDSRGTLGEADNESDLTVDFGFTYLYSVGNRVWFDTNNNAEIDFADGEIGVDGITVHLYAADASGEPTGALIATVTTSDGGYYLFDDLYPGDYVVVIPDLNFASGGVLEGYWSSQTSYWFDGTDIYLIESMPPYPNLTETDSDDNGFLQTTGAFSGSVISQAVTLGGDGLPEPLGESDLQAVIGQGNQPDARANMTVDFGFYKVAIGDLVWADADKDGEYDGGEPLLQGVTVNLYAEDGTTLLDTTTTNASGEYRFDGLPEGTYIISVIAPDGTFSTNDNANSTDTADPNENVDNNDNGVGTGGGEVFSNPVTLTPGSSGAEGNNQVTNDDGTTYNPTIDFGFTPVYSLGNRVWYDTNNNRAINFDDEVGINGVRVQLFDASGNEILVGPDGILGTADDSTGGMLTANGGYYLFNGLEAGEYVVVIPASNFASSATLEGYWSSGTTRNNDGSLTEIASPDPDNDADSDDNGTFQNAGAFNGAVVSLPVTLGPTFNEPTGETDLDATLPGNRQGQPDNQANMTVDFGFYTIRLGNQVWNDLDNSGLLDGSEAGINGVAVQLWSADGSSLLATTTTQTVGPDQGVYTFTGLPQGNYIVRLPESNFVTVGVLRDFRSSTGPANGFEPAPNPDGNTTDSDDNGSEVGTLGFAGGYIQSSIFALTPQAEQSFDHSLGLTTEFRVDFGVFNSPQVDLAVTKAASPVGYYLPGGTLTYTIVVTNNGPADVTGAVVTDNIPAQIASWTWACTHDGGASGCDGVTDSATDFSDTVNLPFGGSITYTVTATIRDDATGSMTNNVTVTPPTGTSETDTNNNEDEVTNEPALLTAAKTDGLSVVAPGSVITYTIEVTNNGAVPLTDITVTDTLPVDVTYQAATPAPTTAPNVGDPGGIVTWTGISLGVGNSTTLTLTVRVIAEPGTVFTNVVVAEDGVTGQRDEDDDTDLVAIENGKLILDTNEPTTVTPNVAIGEIVTYQISLDIPALGEMRNLQALDVLDFGLAFVRCVNIEGGSLETNYGQADPDNFVANFATVCNDPLNPTVSAEPLGNSNLQHQGRRVIFDFGDVRNPDALDSRLVVTYEVVVLNILANQDGVGGLGNTAWWTWDGGSLSAEAPPVEIVEPDMAIVKDATPTVAPYGATINFTLDIAHTIDSTADAFDVVVTDILPPGLAFVPGSVSTTGLPPTSINYDEPGTTLTFTWDHFPLGETALLSFQLTFVGPAPVTNTADLAWTSLPIDPGLDGQPVQQSDHNEYSTERWYDPPDDAGVNTYGASSSISITVPSLPATGFAPGRVSSLPQQPAEKAYNTLEGMWLEIPDLGVALPIVGVPISGDGWDLTWLSNQAGYLSGTTLPGNVGTTGLTAHVTLADGTPGPFRNLNRLYWGNKIIMHVDGYRYVYEVRENRTVLPRDLSVLKQDGYTWLTLITCEGYVPWLDTYNYRLAVRAVLLSVEPDTAVSPFASTSPSQQPPTMWDWINRYGP